MGVPGNANALLLRSAAAAGGYQVSRSLRFNSSDSAYLSRTPASAGNRKTWTWAGWVKRNKLGVFGRLFSAGTGTTDATFNTLTFRSTDTLSFEGVGTAWRITTQVFRDPGAWMHIVLAVDTTQATAGNRIKLYVNGSEITTFGSSNNPTQNSDYATNNNVEHQIGADKYNNAYNYYSDFQLADIHFIDGQALTPSSFTEVSATTGQLIPKAYTGSYGTNGFRLSFSDNSGTTSTTLGKDAAGSNNWTPNNFSVASGSGNDSLVDTPTSYGTDDGLGGSVRGNYATWNPLIRTTATYTNGNLDVSLNSSTSSANPAVGTIFFNSGKWYWEVACISADFGVAAYRVGITTPGAQNSGLGNSASSWCFLGNGQVFNGGTATNYGTSIANGDILNIALDVDAGRIWYGRNGTWFASGNPATNTSPSQTFTAGLTLAPAVASGANTTAYVLNAGARSFAYTAPSGFKALCDTNLPAPVVAKPNTVMDVKLYTGNGGTQSITGLGFNPDLVWLKARSAAYGNVLHDAVRGAGYELVSNLTVAESFGAQYLQSFNSDGFTVGNNNAYNQSSVTYVAWAWDAGSSTVTNTQGSITSSVRANASAGFSIVTYTGTGSNVTVGHGLGAAPTLMIVKRRSTTDDWAVYHSAIGATKFLYLNLTNAADTASTRWQDTAPSSTVFSIGTSGQVNGSGSTYVAYCFAPVSGYSSFGSYTGNGSTDGPFVYTGFRPRWVMWKMSSSTSHWWIIDTARSTYNVTNNLLFPNLSDAESTANSPLDVLSNGFKIRINTGDFNTNAATYVWAAFAENPFQYARAR